MKPILSIRDYTLLRLKRRKPRLPFPFAEPGRHTAWRRSLRQTLWRQFGELPDKVALTPRVISRKDCGEYILEKVLIRSEKWMWIPCWVLIPKRSPLASREGKLPALLASHGHGNGKDDVVGIKHGVPERMKWVDDLNYAYGLEAVKRGYFVIAPDWRTFGERRDPADWVRQGRDGCNVAGLAVAWFGVNLLGLNVWDGMRVIDYLETRREVDRQRIGCVGLSFGGTMTTWLSAFDSRVKVACISGYVSSLENAFDMRKANFCGSQAMPGLALYGDIADAVLLSAPKPLCIEIGLKEECFYAPDMLKAARYVTRGYAALGARDRVVIDTFDSGHRFSGRKAWPWFERWLG